MERKENREDDLDLCREDTGERVVYTVDNRMDLCACSIGPHTLLLLLLPLPRPSDNFFWITACGIINRKCCTKERSCRGGEG